MAATVEGVAQRIARLTPGHDGILIGAFGPDTAPSIADVQGLLNAAVARVNARFGTGDTELAAAQDDAAEGIAAAAVALSWDLTNDDFIDRLRQMAADTLTDLAAGYARLHPGTDPETGASEQDIEGYVGTPGTPVYSFPPGPYYRCRVAPLAQSELGLPGEWIPPLFDGRV